MRIAERFESVELIWWRAHRYRQHLIHHFYHWKGPQYVVDSETVDGRLLIHFDTVDVKMYRELESQSMIETHQSLRPDD